MAAEIERVARNIPTSLNTELTLRHCKYISGSELRSAVSTLINRGSLNMLTTLR
jgi:hypothetical protein